MAGETKMSVTAAYKEYAEFLVQKLTEKDKIESELAAYKADVKGKLAVFDKEIMDCRAAIESGTFQTNIFDTETNDFK